MAIPQYQSQERLNALPGARMQNSADANSFGAGVIRAGQEFIGVAQAKVQEFEYAEALEAANAFQRDVDNLHLDPQKGYYNTRKRGYAANLAQDADKAMSDLAEKYRGKMRTPFMKNAFNEQSTRIFVQQGRANRKWEMSEIAAYKAEEAANTKVNAYNKISLYFDDDAAVALERQRIVDAIEFEMRGAGPEARAAAMAEMESNIGAVRIVRMLEDDPARAREWYAVNKDMFTGEMQGKIEQTLQVYENQEIVTDLMDRFGADESAALAHIRDTYSGARQTRLATDYRQRMNEMYALESRQASQLAKLQTENYQKLVMQYYDNGELVPSDQIDKWVLSGQLSFADGRKLRASNSDLADYSKVESAVLADPLYHDASADEVYAEARRRMNISASESNAYFGNLHAGVLTGHATEADITLAQKRGWISPSDKERLSELEKKYLPEQKKYLDEQRKDFEKELTNLGKNGLSLEGVLAGTDFFMREAAKLDPADPGYREKVFKTKQQALLSSFDSHTGSLRSNLKELQSGYEISRFNILDNSYPESALDMRPSALNTAAQEYAIGSFIQGGGRVSSPFGATEAFRDSGHKGLDIVAPAGTPVTAPQFEGFTVTNVVTGKERSQTKGDAGNYVKMQKTVGGKKVEITYMHLGDVGVKSGDVLQPGQVLGGVGNSGYTVGNTGVHLDVRVKVDGEYVNPIELPFLLANLEDPGPRYSSTFTSDMKNGSEVK